MPKHAAKTESTRAAAAFDEYCAMGIGRSLAKLATRLKTLPGWHPPVPALHTLEGWSSAYGWQERVRAYDAAKAEERAARRERQIEAMNRRQAKTGREAFETAMRQIERLCAGLGLSGRDAVQLLKFAADIERTARGAPATVERHELVGKDGGAIEVTDARDILAARLATLAARRPTADAVGEPDA